LVNSVESCFASGRIDAFADLHKWETLADAEDAVLGSDAQGKDLLTRRYAFSLYFLSDQTGKINTGSSTTAKQIDAIGD
jgi:hypothetical protein